MKNIIYYKNMHSRRIFLLSLSYIFLAVSCKLNSIINLFGSQKKEKLIVVSNQAVFSSAKQFNEKIKKIIAEVISSNGRFTLYEFHQKGFISKVSRQLLSKNQMKVERVWQSDIFYKKWVKSNECKRLTSFLKQKGFEVIRIS